MVINKAFGLHLLLLSFVGFSQEKQLSDSVKVATLNDVVITATRTERQLSSLPLPISIITSADISKAGISRLNEILTEQTGLITVPDFGGAEGIQVQGLDAAYTLILIDGVPLVGRSAGTLDLSRISVGNIDRIEIVKGASSSLYGSEALAGVINIITKKPKSDHFSGNLSYRYASFNTHDATANFVWKKKKFSGSFFTNYFDTNGYDLDKKNSLQTVEPYYNTTIQPKLYYDFSDKLKLIVGTRFYHQKQDNKTIINNKNYQGDAVINEWNSQIKLEHNWNSKINSEYEIYLTNYKTDAFLNNSKNILFEESFYDQWLIRPEIRTTFSINNNKLTAGFGINHETLDRTYFGINANFNSQYGFLQYDYNPSKKWNILAGFRYDNHNQYKSQLSPKIAINYKVTDHLSLKTAVGYGFKAPDFRQLYFDFTNSSVGYTVLGYNVADTRLNALDNQGQILKRIKDISFDNPLKPESSLNFNLGIFYQRSKLKIEVNAFYNAISNLIDTRAIAIKYTGQNVFSYYNVGKIFTYGTEFNSAYSFSNNLKISLGYQYLIAKDKSVIDDFETHQYIRDSQTLETIKINKVAYFGLFNRSKHTANVKFLYMIPKIKTDINLRVFYRSKYGLFDTNNNQILDVYDDFVKGYFITNVSISKQIKEKFSFQVGANNLLDYTNPKEISNLSGRQIFGKLQFNF
ncbi:TonB-dependent receptor [Flavobacterium psychrophilum]|nr:TonB-dependent receptor [Flavobacterium psychrophilum]